MNDLEERKILDPEKNEEDKNKRKFEFSKLILSFFLIISIAFVGFIFRYNVFDTRMKVIVISSILVLNVLGFIVILKNKKYKKIIRFIVSIIMILLIAVMSIFAIYYLKLDSSIRKMNQNSKNNKNNTEFETKDVHTAESFNVYISGIDVGGDLSENSRSDVNIIASVNPNDGKILLTSVPRDTYLPIADGGNDEYDKLTHAGNYGVMSSLHTLERFLEIKIPYFVRVNFDSVIRIVDELGGVDVYVDESFTASVNKKFYPKGNVHLTGQDAIAFVRERYSLEEGDIGRGKNQEKLLAAIIKKVTQPSILKNIDGLLEIMEKNVVTNLSAKSLVDLAANQLVSRTNYDVKSQTLMGEYTLDLPSYAMPGYRLSMMVPNKESLVKVTEEINKVVKNTYVKTNTYINFEKETSSETENNN
ncbi:LCP family protein [Helcococcus bovis]|uniref:LCP family protein n=1 Tax=Helcococcus bovis TaxID=3153252 RepID=UPI0038BB69C4